MIDFELQGVNQHFPGYGEVRLEAGYEWDEGTRTMGDPLITLRDGRRNVLWNHPLPPHPATGTGTVTQPTTPGPVMPTVDVQVDDERTGSDQP